MIAKICGTIELTCSVGNSEVCVVAMRAYVDVCSGVCKGWSRLSSLFFH